MIAPPTGLRVSHVPQGGEASSPFGSLRLQFETEANRVRARTEFSLTRDRVTAEEYPAFRRWVEEADQLLKQRVGFRKEER